MTFLPAGLSSHIKVFDGECSDGSEIRMYNGGGDNPGSAADKAVRCSAACRVQKKPLAGSWTKFVALGFIVDPKSGRCWCESSDAFTCKRGSSKSSYDRYDWKTELGLCKIA